MAGHQFADSPEGLAPGDSLLTTALICRSEHILSCSPAVLQTLPPPMQERHDRLRRSIDRHSFLAARIAAKLLWGWTLGRDPAECQLQQQCPTCGGPHGRPRFAANGALTVSWSHSQDLVGIIVGPGCVAIDVESGSTDPPPTLTRGRTPQERLDNWLLAECWTKAGYCELDEALSLIRRSVSPPPKPGIPDPRRLHLCHLAWTGARALLLSQEPCTLMSDPSSLLTTSSF